MDDAIRTIAARIGSHLAANETVHMTSRNLSPLGAADAAKLNAGIERTVRKRLRNPTPVDVLVTISENARGFLVVAQVRQDVEMASFRTAASTARPKASIAKTMIWQQQDPILDVAVVDDQMIVLDTTSVTRYEHRERAGAAALNVTLPRDPRGRLEIAGESLTVHLPGATCRGTWKPLALACEPGGEFATGRNTIESSAWPPHYSRAHLGEDDLVAETDGRVHDYSARGPARIFDQWGSDLAAVCDTKRVLASGPGDRESRDFVALYELANGALASVSDPAEFPGPVTALSSSLAVTRNLSTGWYEAYSLTVDCGR